MASRASLGAVVRVGRGRSLERRRRPPNKGGCRWRVCVPDWECLSTLSSRPTLSATSTVCIALIPRFLASTRMQNMLLPSSIFSLSSIVAAAHRAARPSQYQVDLFRSNLSPFQLLYVTIRSYGRKADSSARHNSQVRPLPNACGSFEGFECMVLELVGLSRPHARHDRCRYEGAISNLRQLCLK